MKHKAERQGCVLPSCDSLHFALETHACTDVLPPSIVPQDLRDRTYYLSNGVIRVGGRRVATNAANFTKGDTVGCVLDADQVCVCVCGREAQ